MYVDICTQICIYSTDISPRIVTNFTEYVTNFTYPKMRPCGSGAKCRALQGVAMCCSVWQCVALCCSVSERICHELHIHKNAHTHSYMSRTHFHICHELYIPKNAAVREWCKIPCVAGCCNVWQCVAVCCIVLQCVREYVTIFTYPKMQNVTNFTEYVTNFTYPKMRPCGSGAKCGSILGVHIKTKMHTNIHICHEHNFTYVTNFTYPKMRPCGSGAKWGSILGVHIKTKMYMEPSKRLYAKTKKLKSQFHSCESV